MPQNNPSLIKEGQDARDIILTAVQKVSSPVTSTLGPGGRNAIVQQDFRGQRITNDGVTIARSIVFDDEMEDLIKEAFVEGADRTNKIAGDGTSTTILLAEKILTKALTEIGETKSLVGNSNKNAMELRRKIDQEKKIILADIETKARQVKTKKELARVAEISLEDKELGEKVADIVWTIGADGFVDVMEGWTSDVETEAIQGFKFEGGKYIDTRLSTNGRQAVYEHFPVLVTNHKLDMQSTQSCASLFEQIAQDGGRGIVIIAENYDRDSMNMILNTTLNPKSQFKILAIKAPSRLPEEFEDLSVYVNATFVDKEQNMELGTVTKDMLGKADKVVTDEDDTILVGGAGSKKALSERKEKIKQELKGEKLEDFRERIKRRIANMATGVGNIRVGAKTELRRRYLKLKLEDAQFAAKAALQEGIVPGGGLTLKESAENHKDFFIADALRAPFEKIQKNAGGFNVEKDVFDPAKVTKAAVEHACDIAGDMLTTETLIAEKKIRTEYDGLHEVAEMKELNTRAYARKHGFLEDVSRLKYLKHDKKYDRRDHE